MAEWVKMFNPAEGREAEIAAADVKLASEQGWVPGGAPATGSTGVGDFLTHMAERAASPVTLGLSDVVAAELGGDEYRARRAAREEAWGSLGDIAEGAGLIGGALLTGGTSGAARLAARTPMGIASRAASKIVGQGGIARTAGGVALEGAIQAGGQQLSEEALTGYVGGPDAVAERIWAASKTGAIFGALTGAGMGGLGRLSKRFSPTSETLTDWADSAAAKSVMGSRALERAGADGALDIGARLRSYRRPDGSRLIQVGDTPTTSRGRLTDELELLQQERAILQGQIEDTVSASRAPMLAQREALAQRAAATETIPVPEDVARRYAAAKALENAGKGKRGRRPMAAGPEPQPATRPTADAMAARAELAELDARLAASPHSPDAKLARRLAEIDDHVSTFQQALRGGGPDVARGDWVPMAGAAGSIMSGNVLGGVVGAAAGAASRAAGRRVPAIWASILDRVAAGDPAAFMAGILRRTAAGGVGAAAEWTLTEPEYEDVRNQVRQLAAGQAQRDLVVGEVAPNVSNQMLLTQMRAAIHLERTAPSAPKQTDNPNAAAMVGQKRADPMAIQRWSRRVQAVVNPYSVLANPTPEGGEALREVYPKLFNEMRAMLVQEVERTTAPATLQRKVQLGLTFGIPLDPSMGSHASQLNAISYAKLRARRMATPNRGQSMASARRLMGPAEEIESGGAPK